MVKDLFEFLKRLADNNNRPWFQAHKEEFDELREQWFADIDRLIAACSEWEPAYKWFSGRESTFRIYRDTRFSLDKTPYKTYFSAGLTPRGKSSGMAGFYISAGIGDNAIYGGLWAPDSASLKKMRKAMVDNIEEFEEIISDEQLLRLYPKWWGETLKTVPKGWPKDHPQAHLLRLLHYGRELPLGQDFFEDPDWPERAAAMMKPLKPLNDFINYTLFEEDTYDG